MVATNGTAAAANDTIADRLQKLAAYEDAEHERELKEIMDGLVAARVELALAEYRRAHEQQPKRSQMSALEKSQYIRQHGKSKYDELDW